MDGVHLEPLPVKVAAGGRETEGTSAVACCVGVASAATVRRSSGVVVYVMISPANASDALGKGRLVTTDALANATRSAAGALGLMEARLNGDGFRTLRECR